MKDEDVSRFLRGAGNRRLPFLTFILFHCFSFIHHQKTCVMLKLMILHYDFWKQQNMYELTYVSSLIIAEVLCDTG